MIRRRGRGVVVVALACILAGTLGGCWNPFAPGGGGGGGGDPIEWKLRTSPTNVLDNLVTAYKNKKVEEYLDCFSEDFIFFLNPKDVEENPNLEPGYWGKAEERAVHEQMFGGDGTHADRIELTLTYTNGPNYIEGTNPPEYDYQYGVDLRVHMGEWEYRASAPSRFVFRIDQDQVGPDGEQLWEICYWYDLDVTSRAAVAGENSEAISFGRLKAMFRP